MLNNLLESKETKHNCRKEYKIDPEEIRIVMKLMKYKKKIN